MLVFSLVAGFSLSGHVTCPESVNLPNSSYKVAYPFSSYHNYSEAGSDSFPDSRASSGAQFIVTWGIFTDFYCVAALVVYILFTANENMEKVVDLLVYTVRSVVWLRVVKVKWGWAWSGWKGLCC